MRFRIGRPSPSMAVGVTALVFAVAGTALAGVATVSVLSKQEKKQVRKVADRQIGKRAPTLSVASAETAGNVSNQLWATVNADGTLFRGSPGIVGSVPSAPGQYVVTANRDISSCFYVATLGGNSPNVGERGDISVNPVAGNPTQMFVLTSSTAAVNAPIAFTVLVRC